MRWGAPVLLSFALLACAEEQGARSAQPARARESGPGYARFVEHVVPVLEARCAVGCHGVAVADWPPHEEGTFGLYVPIDPVTGRIPVAQLPVAYARTRDLEHRIEPGAAAEFSPLLRKPLSDAFGGLSHHGWDVFTTTDDPDYQALHAWVTFEAARLPIHAAPSTEERFFRDNVLGVMVLNGCFLQSCHGPDSFSDLKLMPPLPRADAATHPSAGFSPRMVHHNRMAMLGKKARLVNLGGDLTLSRVLVKNLPIEAGGVHQRGGNGQFFSGLDDPDVQVLLAWFRLERAALLARLSAQSRPVHALGEQLGTVFIRRPTAARRRFFEVEPFAPDAALWVSPEGPGAPFSLTAGVFDGPVDIQGVDVRYDARAVVFSARRHAGEGFRIYELRLGADLRGVVGSLRALAPGPTHTDDGTPIHQIDPLYTPGPHPVEALHDVAVVFASNAAGAWASSAEYGLLGEADGGTTTLIVDAQRTETPGYLAGRHISFVAGPLVGQTRTIVEHRADPESVVGALLQLDAPLPEVPDRRSVYVIEAGESLWRPAFDLWRLIPGQPTSLRRMTFTSAQERRPTMRTTGEVMFTSVRNVGYQANRPVFNGAIFRVMAGGFDYHIQGGNRSRHRIYADSRELPQGLEVRQVLDPRGWWGAGPLVLADHGFGVNFEPENPVDQRSLAAGADFKSSAQRYLPAQLPIFAETGAEAVTAIGPSPGGAFRDPYPLPNGRVLVTHTPDALDHLDPDSPPDWDLYELRFTGSLQSADGRSVGPVTLRRLKGSTEGAAEYGARPIMVRLKETAHTHQKFAWRADGAKPQDVDGVLRMPADAQAVVECYDYPLLESFLTDFAPLGTRTMRDDLRFVRIIEQQPRRKADVQPVAAADPFATRLGLGVHAAGRIVAEVPVEADGSFYAKVPAEVPLKVQGLNGDRMAVHSMNRWFYLQPGEKLTFAIPRSIFPLRCAGCHGALTGDPVDALGPPDVVTSASRVMATWNPETHTRRAAPHWSPISIDFRRDVQPILTARCVACHSGTQAPDLRADATEHFSVAYESLHRLEVPGSADYGHKRYIDERGSSAAASYLLEKLLGRELEAPQVLDTPGVVHPLEAPLSEAERLVLIRWIDLGATFSAPAEGAQP